jgi:hypothetical protein
MMRVELTGLNMDLDSFNHVGRVHDAIHHKGASPCLPAAAAGALQNYKSIGKDYAEKISILDHFLVIMHSICNSD